MTVQVNSVMSAILQQRRVSPTPLITLTAAASHANAIFTQPRAAVLSLPINVNQTLSAAAQLCVYIMQMRPVRQLKWCLHR